MAEPPTSRYVLIAGPGPSDFRGTGFRLSPTRVLTSLHVVGKRKQLWVLDPNGLKWRPLLARLAWPSHTASQGARGLDIAVLATDPVEGTLPWTQFCTGARDAVEFVSHGYTKGTKRPEDRRLLKGTCTATLADQTRFNVTISEGYPESAEGWKGISGAPLLAVLPGTRGLTLLGIVRDAPKEFEGREVKAVPIQAGLDAPGFREALELSVGQPSCGVFLGRVQRLMTPSLASRLAGYRAEWNEAWKSTGSTEPLTSELCLKTRPEAVAQSLCSALCEAVAQKDFEVAAQVFEMFHSAVPAAYLSHSSQALPGKQATEVDLPHVSEIMAEVANAAIDGRPVRFRLDAADPYKEQPRPEFQLPPPPEPGIDPLGEQRVDDIARDLALQLGLESRGTFKNSEPESDQRSLKYIVRLATSRLLPEAPVIFPRSHLGALHRAGKGGVEDRRKMLEDLVNQRLADVAVEQGRFFIIADAESPESREFLGNLSRRLGEIRKITFSGGIEDFARESTTADAFHRLYLAHDAVKKEKK